MAAFIKMALRVELSERETEKDDKVYKKSASVKGTVYSKAGPEWDSFSGLEFHALDRPTLQPLHFLLYFHFSFFLFLIYYFLFAYFQQMTF